MANVPVDEKKLNPEQKQAVEFGDGPLLIIAGAGTGKTTVVTERIKHLIISGRAKPHEILALTFTEKASREMEERVDMIVPFGYTQMWISTFHTFCDRLLKAEAIHIGLNPAYKLMTDTEATMLFRKYLFTFDLAYFRPLGNPTKFISGILQHFSRLQDEDISPIQYINWVKKQKKKKQTEEERLEYEKLVELSNTYRAYQEIKTKEGTMDFGDLITQSLNLFRERKNILSMYQNQFKYILVDEFQDTNIAQNELVSMLAGRRQNITAVCDDDQSIYKFRGAAVSNVISFRKRFPKVKLIVLSTNYRSTQSILDASYQLIQHNNPDRLEVKEGINKRLIAQRSMAGEWPKHLYLDRVENEADEVAKEIIKIKDSEGSRYLWRDFAILVRANNHAEPFVRALMRHNIPFQFLGPGQLFRQPEIRDLIAYFQVLDNYEDNTAMFRVLSMEHFGLSGRDIATLTNNARKHNISLFESCEMSEQESVRKIIQMIHRHLGMKSKETAGQILYYFLSDTGLIKRMLEYESATDEKVANNVSKFFSKLKTYEIEHRDASVEVVLGWIELSMELGESPLATDGDWIRNDAVNILSVHSAKGLEFGVVFLVNMVAARFPTIERREQIPISDELVKEELPEGDYHLEEERRLCYVGMTRARDLLYFASSNFYGEGKREKKLSPFVYEVFGEKAIVSPKATNAQLSFLDWKPVDNSRKAPVGDMKITIEYLSYSQIETFRLCPLHYKLRYLLKIPTPPTASLSFGNSIHEALRDFYSTHMAGKNVDRALLIELLDKHWQREGYESRVYEDKMKQRGKEFLTSYFSDQFDSKIKTVALEQPFTVPVVTGEKRVKIGGKIDRIDKIPDGKIEIIDYKTGRMPSKRDVDTNLQLSMYAIAVSEMHELGFRARPEDILLSLYFFDTKTKIQTTRTPDQLRKDKEMIINIANDIERSDFRCSGNQLCQTCEYSLFCSAA